MRVQRNGFFTIPITLLIVVVVAVAFQSLGAMLILLFDPNGLKEGANSNPTYTLIATGIAQLAIMLIGTILFSKLFQQNPFRAFRLRGFFETPPLVYALAVPLILFAQFVGSSFAVVWGSLLREIPSLYERIDKFEKFARDITNGAISNSHSVGQSVITFVTIAIVPALAEELFFRGFVQSNIEMSGKYQPRPYVALLYSSVAFAFVHFEPISFPGLLLLGLTLGYMSYRTANLFVGSVGHVANNGAIVLAMLLLPESATKSKVGEAILSDNSPTLSAGLLGLVFTLPIFFACLYGFHKLTEPLQARDTSYELFPAEETAVSQDEQQSETPLS